MRTEANPPEGKRVDLTSYAVNADGTAIEMVYTYEDKPPEVSKRYSKLRLYSELVSEGLWDSLMDWLAKQTVGGMNAKTAFDLAQELDAGYPQFAETLEAAKEALGVTDEKAKKILEIAEVI